VLGAQLRLARQMAGLAAAVAASGTVMTSATGGCDDGNGARLAARLSSCLAVEGGGCEASAQAAESSLGYYFTLWSSYMEAENGMLSRRAKLIAEREEANKAFEKSRGKVSHNSGKQEDLRRAKEEKENELERCTKSGRREVRRMHQRRLAEARETFVRYAESQARTARETAAGLTSGAGKLKEMMATPARIEKESD